MSLWRPPAHNVAGQERQWFECCFRAHGAFCGCGNFILHLSGLAARFNFQGGPPGPGAPRPENPPALRRLVPLPALPPADNQPWPGGDGAAGGAGDRAGDGGAGGPAADAEYRPEDLDDLFAAIERDTESSGTPARTTSYLPTPVDDLETYKYLTRAPLGRRGCSTSGTNDVDSLLTQLSDVCYSNRSLAHRLLSHQRDLYSSYPQSTQGPQGKKASQVHRPKGSASGQETRPRRRRGRSPRRRKRRRRGSSSSESSESSSSSKSSSSVSQSPSPKPRRVST
nr:ORF3 [Torque teno virus]